MRKGFIRFAKAKDKNYQPHQNILFFLCQYSCNFEHK